MLCFRRGLLGYKRLARDFLVSLNVLFAGLLDDIFGQARRVTSAVPVVIEPIAHKLLVEAGLFFANLIGVGCPETRRVGGQNLVAQDDLAVVYTELELGVGDDNAAFLRVACSRFVHLDGQVADGGSIFGPNKLFALLEADVLVVVANLGLRGRSKDGFRQLGGIYQAFGELNATY